MKPSGVSQSFSESVLGLLLCIASCESHKWRIKWDLFCIHGWPCLQHWRNHLALFNEHLTRSRKWKTLAGVTLALLTWHLCPGRLQISEDDEKKKTFRKVLLSKTHIKHLIPSQQLLPENATQDKEYQMKGGKGALMERGNLETCT